MEWECENLKRATELMSEIHNIKYNIKCIEKHLNNIADNIQTIELPDKKCLGRINVKTSILKYCLKEQLSISKRELKYLIEKYQELWSNPKNLGDKK